MKNRKIRRIIAAAMAALSVCCGTVLSAFALMDTEMPAEAAVQPVVPSLAPEQFESLDLDESLDWDDCGVKVDKYNICPGQEYILSTPAETGFSYKPVRVIDRYEEEHELFWLFSYTTTVARVSRLDTEECMTVSCNMVAFYSPKEPFQKAD